MAFLVRGCRSLESWDEGLVIRKVLALNLWMTSLSALRWQASWQSVWVSTRSVSRARLFLLPWGKGVAGARPATRAES